MSRAQNKFQSGRRKAFQTRFLLSYLFILLLPLLVSFPLYHKAYEIVEQKELQTRLMLMRECMSEMDGMVRSIDETLMDMSSNTSLPKLLYLAEQPQDGSSEAALLYSVNKQLSSYVAYEKIENLTIYLERSDLVFGGSSITYGQEWFYENTLSYNQMNYEEFEEKILHVPHFRTAVGNSTIVSKKSSGSGLQKSLDTGILYINSLPLGNQQDVLGTAIVHIDSQIPEILNSVPITKKKMGVI